MIKVHIWFPRPGNINEIIKFGHVSMEIPSKLYVSKYPKHQIRSGYITRFEEDVDKCDRQPHSTITIHNTEKYEKRIMALWYDQYRDKPFDQMKFNCCSAVNSLMEYGICQRLSMWQLLKLGTSTVRNGITSNNYGHTLTFPTQVIMGGTPNSNPYSTFPK